MWGPSLEPEGQVLVIVPVCNIEIHYFVSHTSDYIKQTKGCSTI